MDVPRELFLLILLHIFIGSSETGFIFDCGETKCRSNTDCIEIDGVAQCADPCEHYTALHDDWRSINNTLVDVAHSDRNADWKGWYRLFLGQASAQLPERCISSYRCGASYPMWLNSPHGAITGMIVGRQVCSVVGNKCCGLYSGTIFLKFCYGDYYVYKLLKPDLSGSAYCAEVQRKDPGVPTTTADPKTQTSYSPILVSTASTATVDNSTGTEGQIRLTSGGNDSCSGRVELFHSGQWGTVCDDSWDLNDASVVCRQLGCGRALSAPHGAAYGQGSGPIWLDDVRCFGNETAFTNCQHSGFGVHNCGHHEDASVVCESHHPPLQLSGLICGRDKLQVGVQLTSIASSGLDPFSGTLAAHNCSWIRVNNDVVWYEVEAQAGACGNILKTNDTHAIYSNSLFIYPENNASFARPVSLPFSCVYPLDTDTSLKEAIRLSLELESAVSGSGTKAKAYMTLFRNSNYAETYPAGQVTLPVGSPLYVGVSVEETDSSFVVVLENCFASHSSSPEDPTQYPLIQNKCPTNHQEVSLVESGSSLQARFSALLFMLQDGNKDIYLHCSLSLCDQRNHHCVPGCQRRTSRSVLSSAPVKMVTAGPIIYK